MREHCPRGQPFQRKSCCERQRTAQSRSRCLHNSTMSSTLVILAGSCCHVDASVQSLTRLLPALSNAGPLARRWSDRKLTLPMPPNKTRAVQGIRSAVDLRLQVTPSDLPVPRFVQPDDEHEVKTHELPLPVCFCASRAHFRHVFRFLLHLT